MTFRFKLFKALNGINLFISSFFLLMVLMSLLAGGMFQALISAVLFGAVCIHCVLSLYLQRALQEPSFVLKENTPGGIRIMGGFTILFGGLILLSGLAALYQTDAFIKEATSQMTDSQVAEMQGMIKKVFMGVLYFMMAFSISMIVNAVLSFVFLKELKNRNDNEGDIHLDVDA